MTTRTTKTRNPEDQYTNNKWTRPVEATREEMDIQPKGRYKVPYEGYTKSEVLGFFGNLSENSQHLFKYSVIGTKNLGCYIVYFEGGYVMPPPNKEYMDGELLRNYHITEGAYWNLVEKYDKNFALACNAGVAKVTRLNGDISYNYPEFKPSLPAKAPSVAFERYSLRTKKELCIVTVNTSKYYAFLKSIVRSFPESRCPVIVASNPNEKTSKMEIALKFVGANNIKSLIWSLNSDDIDYTIEV